MNETAKEEIRHFFLRTGYLILSPLRVLLYVPCKYRQPLFFDAAAGAG